MAKGELLGVERSAEWLQRRTELHSDLCGLVSLETAPLSAAAVCNAVCPLCPGPGRTAGLRLRVCEGNMKQHISCNMAAEIQRDK